MADDPLPQFPQRLALGIIRDKGPSRLDRAGRRRLMLSAAIGLIVVILLLTARVLTARP